MAYPLPSGDLTQTYSQPFLKSSSRLSHDFDDHSGPGLGFRGDGYADSAYAYPGTRSKRSSYVSPTGLARPTGVADYDMAVTGGGGSIKSTYSRRSRHGLSDMHPGLPEVSFAPTATLSIPPVAAPLQPAPPPFDGPLVGPQLGLPGPSAGGAISNVSGLPPSSSSLSTVTRLGTSPPPAGPASDASGGSGSGSSGTGRPGLGRAALGVGAGSAALGASHHHRHVGHASKQLEAKVVILGSQGVGKTSLVHRYTSGQFNASSTPSTIGASFLTKKLVVDGVKVRLQLWDTAGQERFRSMAPMYYRGSHAAVIVYDITNSESFDDVKGWLDELRRTMGSDLVIHIVGSKLDLAPGGRAVNFDMARDTIHSWLSPTPTDKRAVTSASNPFVLTRAATVPAAPVSHVSPPYAGEPASRTSSDLPSSKSSPSAPPARSRGMTVSGGLGMARTDSTGSGDVLGSSDDDRSGGSRRSRRSFDALARGGPSGATATSPPPLAGRVGWRSSNELSRGGTCASPTRLEDERGADGEEDEMWSLHGVELSEVSAKDDNLISGIEEVFLSVTKRLVERRERIEMERRRRERESIMLNEETSASAAAHAPPKGPWCCSG